MPESSSITHKEGVMDKPRNKLEKGLVYGVGIAAVINIIAKILTRQHRQSTTYVTEQLEEVQWSLPPAVSPVVHTMDQFWDNMPHRAQQHRQAQLNALTADQRAEIEVRLAQGITKRELGSLITRMAEE